MKNIGKPCAGKLHARFDEGGQARACSLLYQYCSLSIFQVILILGVKSMTGAGGRGRVNDRYGEFLRLTLRGLIFRRLLSHPNFATASNSL